MLIGSRIKSSETVEIDDPMLRVSVLSLVCADVGLPAVSEQQMGVKEVRAMVQLTLQILAEPYSKSPGTIQNLSVHWTLTVCQDSNQVKSKEACGTFTNQQDHQLFLFFYANHT